MPGVSDVYGHAAQVRVAIGVINTWTALTIPVGAKNALLQVEDLTATGRVSSDNTIAPASEGVGMIPATGLTFAGTAAAPVTIYVASDKVTSAILLYTTDQP